MILALVFVALSSGPVWAQDSNAETETSQAGSEAAVSESESVDVVPAPKMDDDEPEEVSRDGRLLTEEKPKCRVVEEKDVEPVEVAGADRVFAGHRFLNLGSQRSALIMSSFNFEQSVFSLDISSFAKQKDGSEIGIETEGLGELLGFSLKLSKLMSVDFAGVMRIQHGPEAPDLLYRGASYQIGGVVGATLQIFRDEEMGLQVSTRPWFSYTSSRNYSVLAFVDGARQLDEQATSDEVLETSAKDSFLEVTTEMSAGGSLLMAYAWDEALAFQASLDVAWSSQESDPGQSAIGDVVTTEYLRVAGAGSVEYDFRSQGLPAAFAVEYKMTYGRLADNPFPTTNSRVSHRIGIGSYYTGRDHLQLGLTYYALLGLPRLEAIDAVPTDPVRESDPAVVKILAFNLYYFW